MKKILFICFLLLFLCSCDHKFDKIPRVELLLSHSAYDTIYLPLREDYIFAEDCYSIANTEQGYDIIIHCIKLNVD